jgi:Fe-Mn family superoxide dismutase
MEKQFKINGKGLSDKQIEEHMKLYRAYGIKLEEIRIKIMESRKDGNATYSDIRELKIEEGFALNAVKLHELFFYNIGDEQLEGKNVAQIFDKHFAGFDNWKKEFMACCLSARGWVVLAYDPRDKRLHNFICDAHNQGGIWGTTPILICDMYEHAYFVDFTTSKQMYIEWFMKHINWKVVEERIKEVGEKI